jgi:hypothetical protein
MFRQPIDLEPFREDLTSFLQDLNWNQTDLLAWLERIRSTWRR